MTFWVIVAVVSSGWAGFLAGFFGHWILSEWSRQSRAEEYRSLTDH
jgi:hypothetical protein